MNQTQGPPPAAILAAAAMVAHAANRAYCRLMGDKSQLPWDRAPDWQRKSAMDGVLGVWQGNGPRESHASWLAAKTADGWVYGEVKDPVAKTHPCMVAYDALPPEQQRKDHVFVNVVKAMLEACGHGA